MKMFLSIYWNRFLFLMLGVNYGKRLRVHNKVYVLGKGQISIGDDFHFTSGDCLNPICRNIRGVLYVPFKESKIEIGDGVGMSSTCIWAKEHIIIGNNVNIGGDCLIIDNDAHPHKYELRRRGVAQVDDIPSAPIVIDDDVWVGAECIILKGVHIGARSIIAAGSVVINNIPEDCVAGGNPCKVIHPLN